MTHVLIDLEIVRAIGLSVVFMGVMLSIITIGISFFLYKILKQKGKAYLIMAGLVTAWAVYMILNLQLSAESDYAPSFFLYSTLHLISIFVGIVVIGLFLYWLPKFWKNNIFDKKLLVIAGIFTGLSILMRLIFPFFGDVYLGLLNRVTIIFPPLIGFFMIIKSYIGER